MSTQSKPIETKGRRGFLAKFLRNRSGSTAIEFTLLSIPFAVLVFAILETCISFAGQQILANATDDIARQIRTGQLKRGAQLTETTLKTMICDRLDVIVSPTACPDEIEVDLQQFTSFATAADWRVKLTGTGRDTWDIDTTGFKVDPGLSQTRNMLRVFYRWPVITDFMSKLVSNIQGGKTLHIATATWQNEPFDD